MPSTLLHTLLNADGISQAAAKRFKITGSGKILMRRPGKQHINEKKSPKRLRDLGKEKEVDHGNKEHIVRNLPYARIKITV